MSAKRPFLVSWDESFVAALDGVRGDVPRVVWLRRLVERELGLRLTSAEVAATPYVGPGGGSSGGRPMSVLGVPLVAGERPDGSVWPVALHTDRKLSDAELVVAKDRANEIARARAAGTIDLGWAVRPR